jgi:hypothetical protein
MGPGTEAQALTQSICPFAQSSCRSAAGTAGRTGVLSLRTAFSLFGSQPRTERIVGAICAVCTSANTVLTLKDGWETSNMTLVSSCANPPCSDCFFAATRVDHPGVRLNDDVRRARIAIRGYARCVDHSSEGSGHKKSGPVSSQASSRPVYTRRRQRRRSHRAFRRSP